MTRFNLKTVNVIALLFISSICYSQLDTKSAVLDIRKKYLKINSDLNSYYKHESKKEVIMDTDGPYSINREKRTSYYKNIKLVEYKHYAGETKTNEYIGDEATYYYTLYHKNKPILRLDLELMGAYPDYYKIVKTYMENAEPFYSEKCDNHDIVRVNIENLFNNYIYIGDKNCDNKKPVNGEYTTIDTLKINKIIESCKNIIDNKKSYFREVEEFYNLDIKEKTLDYESTKSEEKEKIVYYDDVSLIVKEKYHETNMGHIEFKSTEEFYFFEGKLFFYYLKQYNKRYEYDSNIKHKEYNIISGNEKRIYIQNNKPIRILKKEVDKKEEEWKLLDEKEIFELLRKQKNIPARIIDSNYTEIKEYLK